MPDEILRDLFRVEILVLFIIIGMYMGKGLVR